MDFERLFKYPKTPHLPWSDSLGPDDYKIGSLTMFKDRNIVVTEKMDGECTTIYNDYMHARSINSTYHPSRDWLKNWHAGIKGNLNERFRIVGEYLYAKHSIHYKRLPSYFLGFGVWEASFCYDWSSTLDLLRNMRIKPVPVIYRGKYDEARLLKLSEELLSQDTVEGYVVRLEDGFDLPLFPKSVAKWVRPNHVQTDEHWMTQPIVKNELLSEVSEIKLKYKVKMTDSSGNDMVYETNPAELEASMAGLQRLFRSDEDDSR